MVDITTRFYEQLVNFRTPGIHISNLTYDCMRRGYYSQVYGSGFFNLETMIRFWIGNAVHLPPLLKYHELSLEFEGVTGTIDEYEDGTLVDKKHTTKAIPTRPPEHYITQVEYYKVMLESVGKPVIDAGIFYIDVVTPAVKFIPVKLRSSELILTELREKIRVLKEALKHGNPPPRVLGWHCNYCNFANKCFEGDEVRDKRDRWEKAQELVGKGHFEQLTVDDDTVSAKYKDGNKEYAVFLDDDGYFCSCTDHTARKVMCKHLLALLFENKDKISPERYQFLIRRDANDKEDKE